MAERYEDQYRRDRGYRRDERGFIDRAGDEVRSWFGDDDAERRRQLDDRDQMRERGYRGSGRSHSSYYDRGAYTRPVDRESLGDRGSAFSDRGYEDRGYGGYTDRALAYDERPWSDRDYADRYGSGRHDSWRGSPDPGYRPDAWRGMSYPDSPTHGNREMPWSREERNTRSYVGQGPRGYQRSDARINEDVCDRLCDSPDIDARSIDVTVNGGEVTLSGSVSDRNQKRCAEDLIEQVSGVREVHNNLRVSDRQDTFSGNGGNIGSTTTGGEQPGNVLGVTGGTPDKAATAGRR